MTSISVLFTEAKDLQETAQKLLKALEAVRGYKATEEETDLMFLPFVGKMGEILALYQSGNAKELKLKFVPDRDYGWQNKLSLLMATYLKVSIRFPAITINNMSGISQTKVKCIMARNNMSVSLIVQTALTGVSGSMNHEEELFRQLFTVGEAQEWVAKMPLDFKKEVFDIPNIFLTDFEKGQLEVNRQKRKICVSVSVKGNRSQEWSGSIGWSFDLDDPEDTQEYIRKITLELIEMAQKLAIHSGDDQYRRELTEEATAQLLQGRYNAKWIDHDTKLRSPFGGRMAYQWELDVEKHQLILFSGYFGIPKGVDGHNRAWSAEFVIKYEEADGVRNYSWIVPPIEVGMDDQRVEAISTLLKGYPYPQRPEYLPVYIPPSARKSVFAQK